MLLKLATANLNQYFKLKIAQRNSYVEKWKIDYYYKKKKDQILPFLVSFILVFLLTMIIFVAFS